MAAGLRVKYGGKYKYSLRLFVNVYSCDVISHSGTARLIKYSGKSFESVCEC